MEESDTTPEQSVVAEEQASDAGLKTVKAEEQASDVGLKAAKTDDSSSQMTKFERENAKAYSKYKKETIGRVNWHVDRILKGNSKTKEYRDVTDLVMEVIEAHDICRELTTNRYKCALAHCINAKPTKVEGTRANKPGPRTLETLSIGSTTEYDYKILQASSFFRIRVKSLNTMLIELEQKILMKDLPLLEKAALSEVPEEYDDSDMDSCASESSGGQRGEPRRVTYKRTLEGLVEERELEEEKAREEADDDEMPDLTNTSADMVDMVVAKEEPAVPPTPSEAGVSRPPSEAGDVPVKAEAVKVDVKKEPGAPTRSTNGNIPFTGDMLDPTKSRYERFRSFVDQIFYYVECPHEKVILEWMVKCMVDAAAYNDIPNVIMRDKVLEYFKVMLPSLHCSPFTIEPVWFNSYLKKERVIKINRNNPGEEDEEEETQYELARIVKKVMAERRETAALAAANEKERKEREAIEGKEEEEKRKVEEAERRRVEDEQEDEEEGDRDEQMTEDDAREPASDTMDSDHDDDEEEEEEPASVPMLLAGFHHEETIETESSPIVGRSSSSPVLHHDTRPPLRLPCARHDSDLFDAEISSSSAGVPPGEVGGGGSSPDASFHSCTTGADDLYARIMKPREEEDKEGRLAAIKEEEAEEAVAAVAVAAVERAGGGGKEGALKKVKEEEEEPEVWQRGQEPLGKKQPMTVMVGGKEREIKREPVDELREVFDAMNAVQARVSPARDDRDNRSASPDLRRGWASPDSGEPLADFSFVRHDGDEEEKEQKREVKSGRRPLEDLVKADEEKGKKRRSVAVNDEEAAGSSSSSSSSGQRRSHQGQSGSKLTPPNQWVKTRRGSDEENEEQEAVVVFTQRRSPRGLKQAPLLLQVTPTQPPNNKKREEVKSTEKRRSSTASEQGTPTQPPKNKKKEEVKHTEKRRSSTASESSVKRSRK